MTSPSTSLSGSTLNDSTSSSQDDTENKIDPPNVKLLKNRPNTELEARCRTRRRDDAARYLRFVHHTVDDTIQRDIANLNNATTAKEAEWAKKRKQREQAEQAKAEQAKAEQAKADNKRAKRREANKLRRKRRKLKRVALQAGGNKKVELCDKLKETRQDPKERIISWASAIPANANPSFAPKFRK